MSTEEDQNTDSEISPLERAVERVSRFDHELRAIENGTIREVVQKDFLSKRRELDHIRELVYEQEKLDEQKDIRDRVRDTIDSLRQIGSEEEELPQTEAIRNILELYDHILLVRQMLGSVSESHMGLVNSLGNTAQYLSSPADVDIEEVRFIDSVATSNYRGFECLQEARNNISDRYVETLAAYDRLDIEQPASADDFQVLDDDAFEQFGLIIDIISTITTGFVALFEGFGAKEDRQWSRARDCFETAHDTFREARKSYDHARDIGQENPITVVFGDSVSDEQERHLLNVAETVIDTVGELQTAAALASGGDVTSGVDKFESARERLTDISL